MPPRPPLVVVMGVSGSGKSTVGAAIARQLGVPYVDADALHPAENIAAMAAGVPLTDGDRWPWLDAVGRWLGDHDSTGGVVACSALKRGYRDRLRAHAPRLDLLHLAGSAAVVAPRLAHRPDHFMPASLLASQLADLEPLEPDERGLVVDASQGVGSIVDQYAARAAGVPEPPPAGP